MKNLRTSKIILTIIVIFLFSCGAQESKDGGRRTDNIAYDVSDEAEHTSKVKVDNKTVVEKEEANQNPNPIPDVAPTDSDTLIEPTPDKIYENEFLNASEKPISTFSIDVDNASYTNIRSYLTSYNQLPPQNIVRIEEMINYFDYDYENPTGQHPFSFNTEIAECPWNKENKLIHIGIQGKKLDYNDIKPSNFVLLLDVSGSMGSENKLPLLKKSFEKLLDELNQNDRIAIVVYAGSAGLVLPSTPASEKKKIKRALNKLSSGGSTAGGQGIILAYKIAKENFIENGNNRVILATDGDFNVGQSSNKELVELIETKRDDGIFLTILGFGMGNYQDGKMEQISNAGNGNYFYIDNIKEADKVFVKEMRANMFTIAKDVKIQIEFNPLYVKEYRLIGYENRMLAKEDFDDDKKDAGELGAGHTVTAIYEIVTANENNNNNKSNTTFVDNDIMKLKFRYKPPKEEKSILIEHQVINKSTDFEKSSNNFKFSAAVAGFGMLLKGSQYSGSANYDMILDIAKISKGVDVNGYRAEFIKMVETAKSLNK